MQLYPPVRATLQKRRKEGAEFMSTQDNLERVLRDIHILMSRSDLYDKTGEKIIVEKKLMMEQLNRLNACIYEMMDEYEATQQSRDKAEREARKRGERILWNASRSAEDVYAAAVLYTDEALVRAQGIMKAAEESVKELWDKTEEEMRQRRAILKENQSELKGQLQDMVDTEKYLKLIAERNKELEKEKRAKEEGKDAFMKEKQREKSRYESRKTGIRVNPEYFEKIGEPLAAEEEKAKAPMEFEQKAKTEEGVKEKGPRVTVDLDAEYFRWKREGKKRQG